MYIITGAYGFIGSCLYHFLKKNHAHVPLLAVDDFSQSQKASNIPGLPANQRVSRKGFIEWLDTHQGKIECIVHLGARTDTMLGDWDVFEKWNLQFSRALWNYCTSRKIPLIYASSAATYGLLEVCEDGHDQIKNLRPLNPYARSKHRFDLWVLEQKKAPPRWYGLKFFNVYGPNEYHKGRMASMIFQCYKQLMEEGSVRLFSTHIPGVSDGDQKRDFVYVGDVINVIEFFIENPAAPSGIFNVGTSRSWSFNQLVSFVSEALGLPGEIDYISMPQGLRSKYQIFTRANISKLRAAGYQNPFLDLPEGVGEYVGGYLRKGRFYGEKGS